MATGAVMLSANVAGLSVQRTAVLSSDGIVSVDPSVPAAKTGTLSTYSTTTTGTLTTANSGDFETAQVIDLYWTGGRRYGVVVGTVSGASVPISAGAGDDLPVQGTAVTAMVPGSEVFVVGYTGLQALVAKCDTTGMVTFLDSGGAVVRVADLTGTTGGYVWEGGGGATNPFGTTNVTAVRLSHASGTAAFAVSAGAMVN